VAALEYVKIAEEHLANYEAALGAFYRPENLKLLWMLSLWTKPFSCADRMACSVTARMQYKSIEATCWFAARSHLQRD
jgi:hypothetical protein